MSISAQGIGIVATGQYAFKGAMASAPTASAYPQATHAFFTDVGINGTDMVVSASGAWIPHNGRALLTRLTLPVIKSPTINANASGTANGATTLATAVNTAFTRGFFHVPANTIVASHAEGFYYGEMTDTTNITFYNNTYTPAVGVFPTEPTSKTAFSGAVPGGTGSTAEVTVFMYKVNANLLGLYGAVISEASFEANTTATAKTYRSKLESTTLNSTSQTTGPNLHSIFAFKNNGSASRQRASANMVNSANTSSAASGAVDTTANTTGSITLQTSAAATDWAALSFLNVNVEVA